MECAVQFSGLGWAGDGGVASEARRQPSLPGTGGQPKPPPPDRAAGDDCRPPHHRFTERMLVWGSRRSMNHWKPLEASHVAALCSASASPRRWQKPALEFDLASSGTSCSPPQSKSPLLCPKHPLHLSLVSSLAQQSALVSPLVPSTPSRDTSRVQHSGPPVPGCSAVVCPSRLC